MLKYLGCRTLDAGSEDESEAFLNINQLNTNVKPLRVYIIAVIKTYKFV